jgi:hypothetical protein
MTAQTTKYLTQNYAVAYQRNMVIRFGLIEIFYKINDTYYCVIQTFRKKRNFVINNEIEKILEDWYLISEPTNELDIP